MTPPAPDTPPDAPRPPLPKAPGRLPAHGSGATLAAASVGFDRPNRSSSVQDWHPDVDTAVVWSAYARRQRRSEYLHRAKVAGAILVLTAVGFAAILGIDWFLRS